MAQTSPSLLLYLLFFQSATAQGPDMADTVSFMNRSVAPESGFVASANPCELEMLRNKLYTFALPKDSYVKSTDAMGVPHYGFHWLVVTEPSQISRIPLNAIDPGTVESKPVPSIPFLKEHDVDDNPSDLSHPDLMLVTFRTTDNLSEIKVGHFNANPTGVANLQVPIFDTSASMGFLIFESEDRAERFVTAMVHAVHLCGGKTSAFSPTPHR